jgi:uncharacterized protein YhaN
MALDQLTDQEKEALAIGERLEQQEQERDQHIYQDAREGEQESLQFAGKFRTVDDLEKAYLELQKKLGSTTPDEPSNEPVDETSNEPADEPTDEPAEVRREEEGRREQEEAKPQLSQEEARSILDAVGGQEAYNQMIEWGKENLTEADQTAYNEVLATANASAIRLATEGLMARYRANADFQGATVKGRPGSSEPGAKPYRSRAEVNAAMSDARYDSDPAYRQDVMARLAASPDDLL